MTIKKRSIMVAGHATSVSLEAEFWDELRIIAEARGTSINQLVAGIDAGRDGNLSSAIRVFVLNELRQKAKTPGGSAPGACSMAIKSVVSGSSF